MRNQYEPIARKREKASKLRKIQEKCEEKARIRKKIAKKQGKLMKS
jgi:hypothetical protein